MENSFGDEFGNKGYMTMTAEWFREFVFQVLVHKSMVPKDVLNVFDQKPIMLNAWDPLIALGFQ